MAHGCGWRWWCFCCWFCYFIPLNFHFFVDGHALEWGAGFFFTLSKITPANTITFYFEMMMMTTTTTTVWHARLYFISFALFKSIQFQKWNHVFLYKSERTNERMNNMEFERFRCIFCSFEFKQNYFSPLPIFIITIRSK